MNIKDLERRDLFLCYKISKKKTNLTGIKATELTEALREIDQGKRQQHRDADTVRKVCLCGGLGFFLTLGMLAVVDDKASRRMNQRIRQEWRLDSLAKEKKKLCEFSIARES